MMKKKIFWLFCLSHLIVPNSSWAFSWVDLWKTSDQQALQLLQTGKASEAANKFKNKKWQAVADYRAENYENAYKKFSRQNTSDGQYNAGNAAANLGNYQDAIKAYDKAIALNPKNSDAIANRELIKKLMNKKNQCNNPKQNKQSQDKKQDNQKDAQDKSSSQKQSSDQKNQGQPRQNNQANSSKNPNNQDKSSQDQNKQDKSSQDQNNQEKSDTANNQSQSPQRENQDQSQQPTPSEQSQKQENSGQQQQSAAQVKSAKQSQSQDNKKQLYRRLTDDPGGLLRQKFLRDYMNRHSDGQPLQQGDE